MQNLPDIPNPTSGQVILDQLQRFGSDLTRTHDVSFWLYFPSEEAARQAAREAEYTGLSAEVTPPIPDSSNSMWLCLLHCPHIPDESILDGICRLCDQLVAQFHREFDGWESRLELPPGTDSSEIIEELKSK